MTTKPLKKPVINPFENLNKSSGNTVEQTAVSSSIFKEIPKVGNNATQINFDALNTAYTNQDQKTIDEIQKTLSPDQKQKSNKIQFFKRYKREEEEYYLKRKREEQEKKQREELEEQEKIRQQEQARLSQHVEGSDPKGKKKKNIFGKARDIASTILAPEQKPGGGKQ